MSDRVTIALDAMGGDVGSAVVVPAALRSAKKNPDIDYILVGDEAELSAALAKVSASGNRQMRVQHASETVEMDEPPSHALRNKKDSSMRVALNLVKDGTAHACVSAGNTGALMATSRFVLKMLPGIDRPAICTALPAEKKHTWMLDLGANVDVDAEHLLQFALMGSELASAVDGSEHPSIGVLNIGEEEMKGNETVKEAARLIEASSLNYAGFAEGDDIFKGNFDVIVCDGFIGNVALKSSEGLAKMISTYLKAEFLRNPMTKLLGFISFPVLKAFRRRIDPRRYNGASLLGLQGITVKSHGGADALSFGLHFPRPSPVFGPWPWGPVLSPLGIYITSFF